MILVTGATGTVGRLLVDRLVAEGAEVRAVTRDPRSAGLPDRVEVVEGDPSAPGTVAPALAGCDGLFVNPRSVGTAAGELVSLAERRGVRRVVGLSATNVEDDLANQPSRYNGDRNKEVEDAVTSSGMDWVSLRSSFFANNSIGMWAWQIRAGADLIRGPYAASAWAPIDPRDLADVGARALLGGGLDDLAGRRLVLTGPQSLAFEEMVAAIGDALGRHLSYQEVPTEAAKQGLVAHGLPEPFVAALLAVQAEAAGQPAFVSGEVEKVLGRPARSFARWAADHAAEFRD